MRNSRRSGRRHARINQTSLTRISVGADVGSGWHPIYCPCPSQIHAQAHARISVSQFMTVFASSPTARCNQGLRPCCAPRPSPGDQIVAQSIRWQVSVPHPAEVLRGLLHVAATDWLITCADAAFAVFQSSFSRCIPIYFALPVPNGDDLDWFYYSPTHRALVPCFSLSYQNRDPCALAPRLIGRQVWAGPAHCAPLKLRDRYRLQLPHTIGYR